MEINLKKLGEQAIESTTGETKMRLSEDASSMVFQLFTKNVYSNPIGTVVREITSNCFDSHEEARRDNPNWKPAPVVIRKHKDNATDTTYISFIDYGVGMTPDRVQNIYGVYFESTKRVDNTQIGGFGIGGKTPLAYKRSTGQGEGEYDNSFFVITIAEGTKYFYCIYEGAESPVISMLHSEETDEPNGTEIRIPILEKDLDKFESEMIRQLYYFENVVFEGFEKERYNGEKYTNLPNDYQIVRGKNFLFRGTEYSSSIHVCLGRVAYPIDYQTLGLQSHNYNLPIALKLNVGDLNVTVSRESIDYSEETIKFLKKKLDDAKNEIIELISKQYENIVTLEQFFSVKHDFGKLEFPNGLSLYVGNLIKQSDVDFSNFKYQFMKMPNDKQLFRFFFNATSYGKKPTRSRYSYRRDDGFGGGYDELTKNSNLYYVEDEFKRKVLKQGYLREEHDTYYIITRTNLLTRYGIASDIADLFNVNIDKVVNDKGVVDKFVQELLDMQEEYFELVRKNAIDYDLLEVPQDFIDSRKRGSGISEDMRKQSIPVKFINGYSKDRVKLSALFDYNMPIFYATTDEEYLGKKAANLYSLLFSKNNMVTHCDYNGELRIRTSYNKENENPKNTIAFIQIAKNNVRYMKHCKNAKPVSMFFKTMLRRKEQFVQDYFQTIDIVRSFENIDKFYKEGFIDKVSDKWCKKINEVRDTLNNLPAEMRDEDLYYHKSTIQDNFEIKDSKPSPEIEKIKKTVDEIYALQEKNKKKLNYFDLPWNPENMEDGMIEILQVVMDL